MTSNAATSAPPGWYQAGDGQWYPTQPLPQPPAYQHHNMNPGADSVSKPSSNMVGAVLATLFCFFPLGIVACIYASQVDGKWHAGDRIGAVTASKQARLFSNLALGVAVLLFGSIIAVAALGASANKSSSRTSAYINCLADPQTTFAQCQRYR
jgi:Interferon-induced transmembrane protein